MMSAGKNARSSRRRVDEPVCSAHDVGNPIEAAGAGRTKEYGEKIGGPGDALSRQPEPGGREVPAAGGGESDGNGGLVGFGGGSG